jgi:hypothetical protein
VTLRFIVRPAAEVDIAEAALWYDSRSIGLGADFLRAVDVCLGRPLSTGFQPAAARFARSGG